MIDNVGPLLCVQACAGDTELDDSGPRWHGALSLPPPEALRGGGGGVRTGLSTIPSLPPNISQPSRMKVTTVTKADLIHSSTKQLLSP